MNTVGVRVTKLAEMGVGLRSLTSQDGESIMQALVLELDLASGGIVHEFESFEAEIKTILSSASRNVITLALPNQTRQVQVSVASPSGLLDVAWGAPWFITRHLWLAIVALVFRLTLTSLARD